MTEIKSAAAIARWLEDQPQAAAEVIAHIGEDKAEKLLRLRHHYPRTFGSHIAPEPVSNPAPRDDAGQLSVPLLREHLAAAWPDVQPLQWQAIFRALLADLGNA
jgi:hypothetical protein